MYPFTKEFVIGVLTAVVLGLVVLTLAYIHCMVDFDLRVEAARKAIRLERGK